MWQGDKLVMPSFVVLLCSWDRASLCSFELTAISHLCVLSTGTVAACHGTRHHEVDFLSGHFLSVVGLLTQGYVDPSLGIQSLHWAAFLFPKLLMKLASPFSELVGECYLPVTCTFSPGMQMSAYRMTVFYSLPRGSNFFSPRWTPQCTTIAEGLS